MQAKAAKAAQDAAGDAAAGDGPEVIDLEASEPAAAPEAAAKAGRRAGGGKGGGRQRAHKRKGGGAAAAATTAPNGLANGTGAAVADANGAAPMDVADGEGSGSGAARTADSITSANAYLLVYRRKSDAPSQPAPQLPARCPAALPAAVG